MAQRLSALEKTQAVIRERLASKYNFKELLEKQIQVDIGDDVEEMTVREYFLMLLTKLWLEGSDFSSKRPWGNSCWEIDLEVALIEGGVLPGVVERDEACPRYIEHHEADEDAQQFVRLLIANL